VILLNVFIPDLLRYAMHVVKKKVSGWVGVFSTLKSITTNLGQAVV